MIQLQLTATATHFRFPAAAPTSASQAAQAATASARTTGLPTPSDAASTEIRLPLGYAQLAKQYFSVFPPTYDEIEYAIQYTEDTLATEQEHFGSDHELITSDTQARKISELAFNTTQVGTAIVIPAEELEGVFNRLADIIKGLPASQDVIPTDTEFAAYLLILREITHHLGFKTLHVTNAAS